MKENFILAYIFQGLNLWQLLLLFTLCGPEVRQNILVMRKEGCSFMMTNKKNEGIADILDIFFSHSVNSLQLPSQIFQSLYFVTISGNSQYN